MLSCSDDRGIGDFLKDVLCGEWKLCLAHTPSL